MAIRTGSARSDLLTGRGGADTLSGLGGNDLLVGLRGTDTLFGGTGDDLLIGGRDADALFGGDDSDTASYETSSGAVEIDLGAATATGGDAEGDTFSSVENLIGTRHSDVLTGDGGRNSILGENGADAIRGDARFLFGGDGEGDFLYGGKGDDWIYGDALGLASSSIGGGDTLYGGAGRDTLFGDAAGIIGGSVGGSDVLYGGKGDDILYGDASPILTSGGNSDRFVFAAGDGHDTIEDFKTSEHDVIDLAAYGFRSFARLQMYMTVSGSDLVIDLSAANGRAAGRDTLTIKNVTFLDQDSFFPFS